MSTYTPKIVISLLADSGKVRSENAHGEMQMLIEKSIVESITPAKKQAIQIINKKEIK